MLSVQGKSNVRWKDKKSSGFWRGRDSREERLNLVRLGKKHPDIINASLTHMFFFRDQMEEFQPLQKSISFFDFFDVSNEQIRLQKQSFLAI